MNYTKVRKEIEREMAEQHEAENIKQTKIVLSEIGVKVL